MSAAQSGQGAPSSTMRAVKTGARGRGAFCFFCRPPVVFGEGCEHRGRWIR